MRALLTSALVAFLSFIPASAQALSLSNRAGKIIEVELLKVEPNRIHIRMENGQETWLNRELLSDESDALLNEKQGAENDLSAEMNQILGIPLFTDSHLWDDNVESVAKRLRWRRESQTDSSSSFRSYPKADYRILNTRPYSAALYGQQNLVQTISIVFANKGDFKFSAVPTEQEIESMEEAIEADVDRIHEQLTKQLGEPDRQQFGTGRGIKQLILRWDWNDHAFLLASQDGEYASLKIINTEAADSKGRSKTLSDAALRKLTTDHLIQRPNGDVVVGNIPMVNQGPKGYCVPATFERYLRYMQIPADMYILAMAGQTKVGGGTSLSAIIESIDGYISSQSRSMKELKDEIKVRTVKKYIDQGLPIIWTMYSSSQYNEYSNKRSSQREGVTDWELWENQVKSEARSLELRKDRMAAHACLIIGYNKETDEIAVSDSWGPSYSERWISAEQAEQVSQGSIYVISF
ncbi:MAG: hypothetical protein ACSHYA_06515 [Opitutaceae bacterium]